MQRLLALEPNYVLAMTVRVYRSSPAVQRYLEGLRMAGAPQ